MCGLAGILSLAPGARVDPGDLRRMAAQLVHRGPDDDGFYLDPQARCGLAFRRLAIIDVAGGHQPLPSEDRSVWAVCNGEIYNFQELRTALMERGHTFATRSDSEVIVHLYEDRGPDCFRHLAGMFAIAIWDQARGRLVLARDRFGKKPLTWAVHAGRLYFASEIKAILALPQVPRVLDPQSLHRYLVLQYVPAPHSIYRGFSKLPPGHRLALAPGQPPPDPEPYWQLAPAPFAGTYADARARLGELLTAAVRKRLIADVPLGAFLSGGIDSSVVVALMRRLGVHPLRTFSIGFPDARFDETAYARLVARHFNTEHHEHQVTPQARAVLETLAWHYDEPFADSSAIPTYYVSRWTRQSVTVALTGDAGDECFAGYDRYRAVRLAGRLDRLPAVARRALAAAARLLPHRRPRTLSARLHRFGTTLAWPAGRRYREWVSIFPPELLAGAYRPEFRAALDLAEPAAWLERLFDAAPGPDPERAVRTDFASYLPFDLLTKVDIASMACGLECRAPFLDHELVEFAVSLPLAWRLGPRGGKHILRDWAADLLPRPVLARAKMGFGVPVGEWFRGELQDLLRDRLFAPEALCARIFRPEWLRRFVHAHLSGRADLAHPLWALLMLELWHRRWRPDTPALPG